MRVTISVHGEELGDVEVARDDGLRTVGGNPKDELRAVLSDAVAQVQDAYRLTTP